MASRLIFFLHSQVVTYSDLYNDLLELIIDRLCVHNLNTGQLESARICNNKKKTVQIFTC